MYDKQTDMSIFVKCFCKIKKKVCLMLKYKIKKKNLILKSTKNFKKTNTNALRALGLGFQALS